ncbi:MAG: Gfo/Idh/MocA family oxidoreductase [Clostridia bacterium]|nr:Gfo/Idh/MocA family oxidoreductase [Clostridia bacterium]
MDKLRIGLIGCGGRMKGHIKALLEMDDITVVAVADPIEERRVAAAEQFGCTRLYDGYTALLDHESKETLDALLIAIEPTAHGDCELRAIDMGIPFLVEKPMTVDMELAEKINARIEETGLITAVGFQDRYLNLMEMIKEELPKHPAGGLVYGSWVGGIPGVWWWQKKSTCGGQLVEQNIHLLDGLRWLYGEPLSVYATCSKGMVTAGVDASEEYDTDDHSTAVFRFENNVTATLVSGCYVGRTEPLSVRPNCGLMISLRDMVLDYRLRNNMIIKTPTEVRDIAAKKDQTYRLDRAFLDAVRSGDPSCIRSPYGDAIKSLRLGFAANRSMETGEVIYFK